jgi:sortase (surface protein transpeptidase)
MHKKIGLLLLICGLLLILKPLAEHGYTYYQQLQLKNELKQTEDIKDSMADNHQIKPPFLLEIPSISVEAVVVEGVEDKDLRRGPGWDPRGVYPGMEGKLIIAAHNNVYGSYFKDLHKLKAGDMVYIASTKESKIKCLQTAVNRVTIIFGLYLTDKGVKEWQILNLQKKEPGLLQNEHCAINLINLL